MKQKTRVRLMYILDGGDFVCEMGMLKYGANNAGHIRIAVPFYAFDTSEGVVMYDTGWFEDFIPFLEQIGWEPKVTPFNNALNQLKKIGISPADVKKIILSHLHVDHVGGLKYFPEADVYVQKDEYAYACNPNSFLALSYAEKAPFSDPGIKWKFLEGDMSLMPGLTMMMASGHTPGLQALIVELPESGFYILGSDSAYLQDNIDLSIPAGISWDPVASQYTITRFKALQSVLNARYFPGHDYEFFTKSVKYAQAYK
jgi:glyoxylase-like metal-dependent hydrolase (beta-lactamase superfamily II)